MFCPSCGTECTVGLNYCNRCGANLAPLVAPPAYTTTDLTRPAVMLGIITMFFTLGGFLVLIGGARALASVVHGNDPLIAIIFLGMLIVLTVDIILVRQITKLINAALFGSPKAPKKQITPPLQMPQLSVPSQSAPIVSVTENTTRFLEAVPERQRHPTE